MAETVLIVVLVLVVLLFARWYIKRAAGRMATLTTRGLVAEARIVKVEKKRLSRTDHAFRVTYVFAASDGEQYTREFDVLPSDFEAYREGQAIDVVYDPQNPKVSVVKASFDDVRKARIH